MTKASIDLEIRVHDGGVVFDILFNETGEIRRKVRSKEWFLERIFNSELKTYAKNGNEKLILSELSMRGGRC